MDYVTNLAFSWIKFEFFSYLFPSLLISIYLKVIPIRLFIQSFLDPLIDYHQLPPQLFHSFDFFGGLIF